MISFIYRYEQYHRLCTGLRKEEMRKAGLLEEMAAFDTFSPNVFLKGGIFEAMVFPIAGFIFGVIPALQAVIMHVFTERLTYIVSLKPLLANRQQQIESTGSVDVDIDVRSPSPDGTWSISGSSCDAV